MTGAAASSWARIRGRGGDLSAGGIQEISGAAASSWVRIHGRGGDLSAGGIQEISGAAASSWVRIRGRGGDLSAGGIQEISEQLLRPGCRAGALAADRDRCKRFSASAVMCAVRVRGLCG